MPFVEIDSFRVAGRQNQTDYVIKSDDYKTLQSNGVPPPAVPDVTLPISKKEWLAKLRAWEAKIKQMAAQCRSGAADKPVSRKAPESPPASVARFPSLGSGSSAAPSAYAGMSDRSSDKDEDAQSCVSLSTTTASTPRNATNLPAFMPASPMASTPQAQGVPNIAAYQQMQQAQALQLLRTAHVQAQAQAQLQAQMQAMSMEAYRTMLAAQMVAAQQLAATQQMATLQQAQGQQQMQAQMQQLAQQVQPVSPVVAVAAAQQPVSPVSPVSPATPLVVAQQAPPALCAEVKVQAVQEEAAVAQQVEAEVEAEANPNSMDIGEYPEVSQLLAMLRESNAIEEGN